jgi:hypothetical protein
MCIRDRGGFVLASPFEAFVLPPVGRSAAIVGRIESAHETTLVEGISAWREACEKWSATAAAAAGARLVTADCGEPTNELESGHLFGSTAKLEVASGIAGLAPVASGGPQGVAAYESNFAAGIDEWRTACTDSLALAKNLLGDRFIVGSCGAPKNMASERGFLFSAPTPILAMPAGKTKVTVESWVASEYQSPLADAGAAFLEAANAQLRASVAAIGAARVEGLEVAAPTNAPLNSGFVFIAPTRVMVGIDLPEGGLAPVASTSHVKPPYADGGLRQAFASWMSACADAAAKAKRDGGARFVGAGCGKPTVNGSIVESDFTTWLLP